MKMMKYGKSKSKRKYGKSKSKRKYGKSKLKVRLDGAKTIQELIIENIKKYNLYDLLFKRHDDFKKTHGFERYQLVNYIADKSLDCEISIATYDIEDQLINRFDELIFKYFNLGSQKFFSNDKKDLSIFIIGDKVRVKVPERTNITTIKIWINIEENDNLIYIDYSRIAEKEPIIKLVNKLFFDYYTTKIFPNDKRFDKKGLLFLSEKENRIHKLLGNYVNDEQFTDKIMNSINKYQYCNYLDFDEKIEYGFFDPGEQKTETISSSIGDFARQKDREIILCDSELGNLVRQKIPRNLRNPRKNYIEVIMQIVNSIIEPLPDEGSGINVKYKNNNDPHLKNNIARLSNIKAGVCRHRSILFKFIIDNIETLDPSFYDRDSKPLRCSLERGYNNNGKHAWCTYSIGDKIYIYDPWLDSMSGDKFKETYGVSSFGGGNTVALRRDD